MYISRAGKECFYFLVPIGFCARLYDTHDEHVYGYCAHMCYHSIAIMLSILYGYGDPRARELISNCASTFKIVLFGLPLSVYRFSLCVACDSFICSYNIGVFAKARDAWQYRRIKNNDNNEYGTNNTDNKQGIYLIP